MITPPNQYTGRFITLDGSEGVGKSTQIPFIAQWLADKHIPYILTREPGGTNLGEQLRDILINPQTEADDISELLIILAARRQHLIEKIWPALEQGQWVICDRFNDSTYAYQGSGRGIDNDLIAQLEQTIMGSFTPDKRFIFTLDDKTSKQRLQTRAQPQDRFEQEKTAFFARIEQGFYQRLQATNAVQIDASQNIEQVFAQISHHLEALL